MAINNTLPIRDYTVNKDTGVVYVRHGQEDGTHTVLPDIFGQPTPVAAGRVIVETNGVLRVATDREASNYHKQNQRDALEAALKTRAGAIDVPVPTPLAIKEYLKAKFPGDFA